MPLSLQLDASSVEDPLLGRLIDDRYRIVEPLGAGAMGSVYLAMQEGLDRHVALKVLQAGLADRRDLSFVKRFCLEASITARLAHPNVVTIHDYGRTEDGIFFIAMEYLEGRTLARVVAEEGALAPARVLSIGRQIARGVREAHRNGLVHRDLKPANVMLLERAGEPDFVKVLDFGLARFFAGHGQDLSQSGTFLGSPQYMAPELVRNEPAGPRSDVYALGVMLYEMVCGEPPFAADSQIGVLLEHAHAEPRSPRMLAPQIPAALERAILRAMRKDPADRYADMDAFLRALDDAAGRIGEAETAPAPLLDAATVASLEVGARRRAWRRRLLPWVMAAGTGGALWSLSRLF